MDGFQWLPIVLIVALAWLGPTPAKAAFRATVTRAEGFDLSTVKRVVVVTRECHEVVDCSAIERQILGRLAELEVRFETVPESRVRNFLFERGELTYDPALRQLVAETFEADALLEVVVPFAERGDGFGGRRRSNVKVEIFLLRPDGPLLLHGVGTGRPLNVVSGPERVTGKVVETILEEAFGGH